MYRGILSSHKPLTPLHAFLQAELRYLDSSSSQSRANFQISCLKNLTLNTSGYKKYNRIKYLADSSQKKPFQNRFGLKEISRHFGHQNIRRLFFLFQEILNIRK
ncbi:hypothetical protein CEXT_597201 [Caerostris extrusa]|uniref:Uncharacterized protein n=1 Tax=Caerostris extrusa TaxID=172846 RepID=A0AAV4S1M8_CAEEX|nr:hypothetical protein CEXT_597201 [Caerostris extrusa]